MDEQTCRKIYQTTSLVAGLAAVGAMALMFILTWNSTGFQSSDIRWSACCYVAILGSVTSLVAARLGKKVKPLQTLAVTFAILILLYLLLMDMMRQNYADFWGRIDCKQAQRIAFARMLPTLSASFPILVKSNQLPRCTIILKFPWAPAVPRPVGMNVYLAGKKLGSIPHPERTVCFADCLPADRRIRGPQDIDWDRHGSANIQLCDGVNWNEHVCMREELIFNPWPNNAPRSLLPPAHSHPAPPASRRP
jgi:hypothetical protein